MNHPWGQRAGWGLVAGWMLTGAAFPARGGWTETRALARTSGQFLSALAGGSASLAAPALSQSLLQARDPGATLLTDADYAAAERRRHGIRRGLGFALLRNEQGEWRADSPGPAAAAAGLRAGDGIERMLDRYLTGLNAGQVDALCDGPLPDPVEVTILRPGERQPRALRIPLTDEPEPPLGKAEMLPRKIGYLPLHGVWTNTPAAARRSMDGWLNAGVREVILDLRGAEGDDAPTAAMLAGWAVPPRTPLLVFQPLENRPETTLTTPPDGAARPLRLAVLVDARTGGAAELLAAALQTSPGVRVFGAATAGDPLTREGTSLGAGWTVYAAARRVRLAGQPSDASLLRVEPDASAAATPAGPDWAGEPVDLNPDRGAANGEAEARRLARRVRSDPALAAAADYLLALRVWKDTPPVPEGP